MESHGVQISEIIVQAIACHYKRAIMRMQAGTDAEGVRPGEKKGDIICRTDEGVIYDMMSVIIVVTIFKGIEINTQSEQDKDSEHTEFFHFISPIFFGLIFLA